MNAFTRRYEIAGPAGRIQVLRDSPEGAALGTAVIAHPHPLFGGTMDNKVVQTIARAFVQAGWSAIRFNFRGVGTSEGVHDEGRGEAQDMMTVVAAEAGEGPLALCGFSFGAFVASMLVEPLAASRDLHRIVLVGTATTRFGVAPLATELHDRTLVIHGEQDDTVPLGSVMDWARPQTLPVTVVPGGGHFFHGQLPLLKNLVLRHLR